MSSLSVSSPTPHWSGATAWCTASGPAASATTAAAARTTTAWPSQGRVGCGLGRDGGLAEYVLVPDARHFVTATGVAPTALAPLADAGLTAYHAIRQHRDALVGDCAALVIGVGGLGHLAVQILRATTAARVVASDPRPEACALAERLGAHHTAVSVDEAMAGLADSTGSHGSRCRPGLRRLGRDHARRCRCPRSRWPTGRGRRCPRQPDGGQGSGPAPGLAGQRPVLGVAERSRRGRRARRAGAAGPGGRGGLVRSTCRRRTRGCTTVG